MSTLNCLCQIAPLITNTSGGNKYVNRSWLKVSRKRLTNEHKKHKREDVILVYAPILIGMCKAYFKTGKNATATANIYNNNIAIVPSYHGMETDELNKEGHVMRCGRWMVWNNKEKSFNHPVDYDGYWILKFPKDYWDVINFPVHIDNT